MLRCCKPFTGWTRHSPCNLARDNADRRTFAVSGIGATALFSATGTNYEQYAHQWLTSAQALYEIGGIKPDGDPIGNLSFGAMIGIRPLPAFEDPILRGLSSDRLDLTTGKRKGYFATRNEWEQDYSQAMLRATPAIQGARK